MFKGRSLCTKIGGQGQKNVIGRTLPANFQKFIIIFYGILKMTQGISILDSEPETTSRNYNLLEKSIAPNAYTFCQSNNLQ